MKFDLKIIISYFNYLTTRFAVVHFVCVVLDCGWERDAYVNTQRCIV